jgi:hypothetical protein
MTELRKYKKITVTWQDVYSDKDPLVLPIFVEESVVEERVAEIL